MENPLQQSLQEFLKTEIQSYFEIIDKNTDNSDHYFQFFKSLEDYKRKLNNHHKIKFVSDIQNALFYENTAAQRLKSFRFLLDILELDVNSQLVLRQWNDYYSDIEEDLSVNPYQRDEIKNFKNNFIFYVYFDNENELGDAYEIVSRRDLLVGDLLDFGDHEFFKNLEDIYETPIFKIVRRQYSVRFGEMNLYLIPHKIL